MKSNILIACVSLLTAPFVCGSASAHDPVLVGVAARMKRACPQAVIRYDTRDIFLQDRLPRVIYPEPNRDEYLVATYHVAVFDTYGTNQFGQLQKQRPLKLAGPDNQGFRVIVYTHPETPHTPKRNETQSAFPKSFPHLREYYDGGGWIEYINRYRLRTAKNADIWLDLSYGRKSDWRTLKKIKQAVFADARPIDQHDFPFYF
jgi:hypothetical protein